MKWILVGKCSYAEVYDEEWLSRWKWQLHRDGYAYRTTTVKGKRKHIKMHRLTAEESVVFYSLFQT
ncbi:hypothetical protein ABD76_23855 [Paenibacillus dendritiformis]|uniref:hypothetical protein n=1 Tax=Paenibacillus dendritiformis TaxID=130049 RepID=UPI0018CEFDB2|nr:hypothetical protein [Paenibacillus dendritiformis]MBG9795329.1 hypothetical protein [Paenibacillus dendritiformis]